MCIWLYAPTKFIEYFKTGSTSAYVAFLAPSKAFDQIDHWIVFKKLIARNCCVIDIKTSHCISNGVQLYFGKFYITNCVRQWFVLAPLLFNVYVDELSDCLNKSGNGRFMNGIVYITCYMLMTYVSFLCLQQVYNNC